MAVIRGFRAFVLRGNVVDLAIGIVVGAAFNSLVQSFVDSFITPLIQLFGAPGQFGSLFFRVRGTVFPYGQFIGKTVSFLIVCGVIYFLVLTPVRELQDRLVPGRQPAPTRECPYCISRIPLAASRCMYCTSEVHSTAT